jgi:hypothetical protein
MTDEQRRLLELLAGSDLDGCTDVHLLAQGFTLEMITDMVRTGLAVVEPGRVLPDGGVEHTRLWITDAGRRALDEWTY